MTFSLNPKGSLIHLGFLSSQFAASIEPPIFVPGFFKVLSSLDFRDKTCLQIRSAYHIAFHRWHKNTPRLAVFALHPRNCPVSMSDSFDFSSNFSAARSCCSPGSSQSIESSVFARNSKADSRYILLLTLHLPGTMFPDT
jgi:hypothetical protein